MDDDDLTQDILDQFDLICTQHQAEVGIYARTKALKVHGPNNAIVNRSDTKLVRTTSLDAKTVSKSVEQCLESRFDVSHLEANKDNEECDRLRKEVTTLREELYMKLGELATIKESANRTNAAKSDTIIRLENNLNTEREEFQRRLSELTTQLAFREADYRLVTSELARVKEQAALAKPPTPQKSNFRDPLPEYSPASQLIASMAISPQLRAEVPVRKQPGVLQSPTQNHLPNPVTPVPSRRRPKYADGTWTVPVASKVDTSLSPPVIPLKLQNGFHPNNDTAVSVIELPELSDYAMLGTPRKRPRPSEPDVSAMKLVYTPQKAATRVDVAVATDFKSSSGTCGKLHLRIPRNISEPVPSLPVDTALPTSKKLASDLLQLVILEEADHRYKGVDGSACFEDVCLSLPGSSLLWTDHYLRGMRILTTADSFDSLMPSARMNGLSSRKEICATSVKALTDALPDLLFRIEALLKLFPTVLVHQWMNSYTPCSKSSLDNKSGAIDEDVLHAPVSTENDDTQGMSYLGEDPFAGAPASQVVTPLSTVPFRRVYPMGPRQASTNALSIHSSVRCTLQDTLSCSKSTTASPPTFFRVLSPQNQAVFHLGLSALKQVQCMLTATRQWRVMLSDYSTEGNVSYPPVFTIISNQIGRLISTFVKQLVDIHVSKSSVAPVQSASSTMSLQNLQPFTTTTQTQFSTESVCRSFAPLPEQMKFPVPTSLTDLLLNIADSLSYLIPSKLNSKESKCDELASEIAPRLEWTTPFTDYVVLVASTQGNYSLGVDMLEEQFESSAINSPNTFTSLILFIRLARSMVSAGLWNLGHQTGHWWQNVCQPPHADEEKSDLIGGRYEAIHRLFGANINCCLRSILSWVRNTFDQFCSMLNDSSSASVSFGSVTGCDKENSLIFQELKLVEMLSEFSRLITALVERPDINWPDTCLCKAEVYATLIHLAKLPVQRLLTLPNMTVTLESLCLDGAGESRFFEEAPCVMSAFGHFTRALTSLLWRHGDSCFQTYTDCLPSYFFVISSLSKWIQKCKTSKLDQSPNVLPLIVPTNASGLILRPELVEELHDFESTADNSDSKF